MPDEGVSDSGCSSGPTSTFGGGLGGLDGFGDLDSLGDLDGLGDSSTLFGVSDGIRVSCGRATETLCVSFCVDVATAVGGTLSDRDKGDCDRAVRVAEVMVDEWAKLEDEEKGDSNGSVTVVDNSLSELVEISVTE